jgi:signal transduction histidine kinase
MHKLVPDAAVSAMLAAEELAASCLEADKAAPTGRLAAPEGSGDGLRPAALPGVWKLAASNGRILALFRTESLLTRMRAGASSQTLPPDISLTFLPPGKEPEAASVSTQAGPMLPGWRLALALNDQRLFVSAADQQIASYVWIGALVLVTVAVLAALALGMVRRQMALTRLRNDLVANVSHELKTPLSSMRLLVETLLNSEKPDPRTVREYLELIAQENLRLSRLIDNFLTFSRIERNKYAFKFKELPAARIIEEARAAIQDRFNAAGCAFACQVAPNLPLVVADQDAMVTVLLNLLDNAFKYTGEGKQISLEAAAENGCVRYRVKDNGIGLSSRDIKRIFKRFFQVDQRLTRTGGPLAAPERSGGGCGLGLSIVKFIVTAHHGRIEVDSQPRKGSTFTVSIPAKGAVLKQEQKP